MGHRDAFLERLSSELFDVAVVGGGINGAVSAAALASRGARVALIDRGDFAGGTSMQSSNLAWGGIKYLESLEFGLVRGLCRSRNALLEACPSSVEEVRFLAVHPRGFRHGLSKLVAGAWLYWLLGSGFTQAPRRLGRVALAREEPALDLTEADGGFEYSDAFLRDNDARFSFGFVRTATQAGAVTLNHVALTAGQRTADGLWQLSWRDGVTGLEGTLRARHLVNAAGPWADEINRLCGLTTRHRHLFSKGIHLIVPAVTQAHRVLTFFADDGRPFFVIPMAGRSCIGTTDTPVERPETVVTDEDRRFVLENVNKRLRREKPLTQEDVIAERCGVRPLAVEGGADAAGRDWMHLSRRHVVEVLLEARALTLFGGKLTDCLNVGEEVCEALVHQGLRLPTADAAWYGEPGEGARQQFLSSASGVVDTVETARLWRRYGTQAADVLALIRRDASLGRRLVDEAPEIAAELVHAVQNEQVVRLEDFLRRRTPLALVVRREALQQSLVLREACEAAFGSAAPARWAEWAG